MKKVVLLSWILISGLAAFANESDVTELLSGVKEIGAPGLPGPVCVFGEQAFAVVTAAKGGVELTLIGAARYGRGRVVVLGHEGYLSAGSLQDADTGRLILNAVEWVSGEAGARAGKPRVGVYKREELAEALAAKGLEARAVQLDELNSLHVLILAQDELSPEEVARIQKFTLAGRGIIVGGLGWGWQQLNPGKDLRTEHPGNQVLAPMGLIFADGTLGKTSSKGYTVAPPGPFVNAADAFGAMERQAAGTPQIKRGETGQVSAVLAQAAQSLPLQDTLLMPRLLKLSQQGGPSTIPTKKSPIKQFDLAGRLAVTVEGRRIADDPTSYGKHPAADSFPGPVPDSAERVTTRVAIDTAVPGRHSTGLYAAPGERIRIEVPASVAGKRLSVRIGAHSDTVWHKEDWQRFPEISYTYPVDKPSIEVANPFGGLIYLELPGRGKLPAFEATISGAVKAPYFVLGQTRLRDWQSEIRDFPGPWAELASDHVILTVPSEVVRGLGDPVALMRVWDRILDLDAELAGIPRDRPRPERVVTDQQISAGYMHSGYPVMTWMDQTRNFVNVEHLTKEGNWGIFHEFGHNHQEPEWTFDGTTEVTCNLFSLYVYEYLVGIKPKDQEHTDREGLAKQFKQFDFRKPDFATWRSKPFLALAMYAQLQEAFGWEPYRAVFREYRALPRDQKPRNDQEKRDQWMIRFSRQVGRNLGPFFQVWGIPVTEQALASIRDLPGWMPEDFPPRQEAGIAK